MSGNGGGGGGGNPALEEDPPEHENHERYLLTYADMITLLLALFIVLFAIGQTDQQKFNEFRAGLASEFGNTAFEGGTGLLTGGQALTTPVTPSEGASSDIRALVEDSTTVEETTTSTVPATTTTGADGAVPGAEGSGDTTTTATTVVPVPAGVNPPGTAEVGDGFAGYGGHIDSSEAGSLEEQITGVLEGEGFKIPDDFFVFTDPERGVVIRLATDSVTFASGSSQLSTEGRRALDALVPALSAVDNDVSIDGYTDSDGSDASNVDLSVARAASAVKYFQQVAGDTITGDRLAASGHGEYKNIASNDTPEGRQANRRVEIVIQIDSDELGVTTTAPATAGVPTVGDPTATTGVETDNTVLPVTTSNTGPTTRGTALPPPATPVSAGGAATTRSTPSEASVSATASTSASSTRSGSRSTTGRTPVVAVRGCVTDDCVES